MPSASLARAFEKNRSDVAGTKSMERSNRTGCLLASPLVMGAMFYRNLPNLSTETPEKP